MIITITGTPGTGKTYIAKKIADKNWRYIDLNLLIKKEKLYDKYDRKDKTYNVDVKKLRKFSARFRKYLEKKRVPKKIDIEKILRKYSGIIIDSHLSHYIDSDLCVILKTDIKKLSERLKKRKYSKKKIRDNVESEIFDICGEEAKKLKRKIVIVVN